MKLSNCGKLVNYKTKTICLIVALLCLLGTVLSSCSFSSESLQADSGPSSSSPSTVGATAYSNVPSALLLASASNIELKPGETKRSYFITDPKCNLDKSSFLFVSDNTHIADIAFDEKKDDRYYFIVTAISAGKTTISIQTVDGNAGTETVHVLVQEPETEAITQPPTEAPTKKSSSRTDGAVSSFISSKADDYQEPQRQTTEYVLNTRTKKVHFASCSSVKQMSTKNYDTTTDLGWALSHGYVKCKRCSPY